MDTKLQMELLMMKATDNRGIGYPAHLAVNGAAIELSDQWYWQGVCDALQYTNPQFIKHVKKLKTALLDEAKNGH